jgi:hypothetical protein
MLERIVPMDQPGAIWRFQLGLQAEQLISMPKAAQILCVQLKDGSGCMWAIVDPMHDAPRGLRRIITRGTGHQFDNAAPLPYIGTYQTGPYVWHVFDGGDVE